MGLGFVWVRVKVWFRVGVRVRSVRCRVRVRVRRVRVRVRVGVRARVRVWLTNPSSFSLLPPLLLPPYTLILQHLSPRFVWVRTPSVGGRMRVKGR